MSTAVSILACVMLVGFAGTTILCAVATILRNRDRLRARLHEIENYQRFTNRRRP